MKQPKISQLKIHKAGTQRMRKKMRKAKNPKRLIIHVSFSSKELQNPILVADALLECIRTADLEAFQEILIASAMTSKKIKLSLKEGLGSSAFRKLTDSKKNFDPKFRTILTVFRALKK